MSTEQLQQSDPEDPLAPRDAGQSRRSQSVWWFALVLLLVVALRVDWQQRTLHTASTALDQQSHLIGRLVRFVDEELVSLVSPRQLQQAAERTGDWWRQTAPATSEAYRHDLQALLEARVSDSFDAARGQVDAVADWYYRIGTNYALLLELGRELTGNGDVEAYLRDKIHRILFVEAGMEARLDRDLGAALALHGQRLDRVADAMGRHASRQVHDAAAVRGRSYTLQHLPDTAVTRGALTADWSGLRDTALRDVVWQPAISGLGATVVAAGAGRLTLSAAVRGAGGQVARQAGVRAGGRAASAGAGLSAAGAGAAVCGPLAAVCAPLAGLAVFGTTWLASDLVVTSADEAMNRDAFSAILHRQIAALEARTITDLQQRLTVAFDSSTQQLADRHQQALLRPLHELPPSVVPGERLRRP